MDVTKITLPGTMTAADLAFDSLVAQMSGDYVYFGAGTLSEAELASLDSAFAWDDALEASFNLLGELAESACKVDSKLSSLKTRKYRVSGKRTTTLELNLVGLSQLQKQYLESPAFSSRTLTLVLRSRAKDALVVFTGLKWTCSWSGEVDGLFTVVISSEFTGTTAGKIYAVSGIPTTGIFMINEMLPFAGGSGETTPTQSFQLAAYQVSSPITLTAPTGFHISTAESSGYAAELTLPATFNGTIYARLVSETLGAHSGNLSAVAEGAAAKTSAVSGYLGDGTETYPLPISTPEQLAALVTSRADGLYYKQFADIDLSKYDDAHVNALGFRGWEPLGYYDEDTNTYYPFTGSYDGNGHSITGLYIRNVIPDNPPESAFFAAIRGESLFGVIGGTTVIKNLRVSGYVHGIMNSGLLVGISDVDALSITIENVVCSGTVLSGIKGLACNSAICAGQLTADHIILTNIVASGSLWEGTDKIGGLCGYLEPYVDASIENCSTAGKYWTNDGHAGGLIGYITLTGDVTIKNCYSIASVQSYLGNSGDECAGGLIGAISAPGGSISIQSCYAAGKVIRVNKSDTYGGFFGTGVEPEWADPPSITSCYYLNFQPNDIYQGDDLRALSQANLMTEASFLAWDFTDVWSILEGKSYPILRDNPII